MDKWDLQTIKEIVVRKKSKKLWILKNLNVNFSSSDKEIEEKVKKIMDSKNVYKIYLNAKQLWILKKVANKRP